MFLVARDADEVVGFAYGYTGAYGRWWTEHVAAALSPEQRARWLDPPHYEIVELHVRPASQRRGLGSALLAQLLTRQPHDRAVLTTQAGSRKARKFYAKNGWEELANIDFGAGYPPYVVLARCCEDTVTSSSRLRRDTARPPNQGAVDRKCNRMIHRVAGAAWRKPSGAATCLRPS